MVRSVATNHKLENNTPIEEKKRDSGTKKNGELIKQRAKPLSLDFGKKKRGRKVHYSNRLKRLV